MVGTSICPSQDALRNIFRQGLASLDVHDDGGDDGQHSVIRRPAGTFASHRTPTKYDHGMVLSYSSMPVSPIPVSTRVACDHVDDHTRRSSTSFVRSFSFTPALFPRTPHFPKDQRRGNAKEYPSRKGLTKAEDSWGYTVTELSEEPLDPALFTVPADFKKIH